MFWVLGCKGQHLEHGDGMIIAVVLPNFRSGVLEGDTHALSLRWFRMLGLWGFELRAYIEHRIQTFEPKVHRDGR